MEFSRAPFSSSDLRDNDRAGLGPRIDRRRLFGSRLLLAEDFSIRGEEAPIKGYTPNFQLALPYRGLFGWNVGKGRTLVDSNQLLFIAGDQSFVEHQPVAAIGHASVILTPEREALAELLAMADRENMRPQTDVAIPVTHNLRLLLQHWLSLRRGTSDNFLRIDELAIETFREAMRIKPPDGRAPSLLVARAKQLLHELVSEPLSLQQLADALGVTPAYLTQTFSRAEGMPLYRYQLHLRLARAMVELPEVDDLTALALELGFSSHSHFTTAFKSFTKHTPSAFRDACRRRHYSVADISEVRSTSKTLR